MTWANMLSLTGRVRYRRPREDHALTCSKGSKGASGAQTCHDRWYQDRLQCCSLHKHMSIRGLQSPVMPSGACSAPGQNPKCGCRTGGISIQASAPEHGLADHRGEAHRGDCPGWIDVLLRVVAVEAVVVARPVPSGRSLLIACGGQRRSARRGPSYGRTRGRNGSALVSIPRGKGASWRGGSPSTWARCGWLVVSLVGPYRWGLGVVISDPCPTRPKRPGCGPAMPIESTWPGCSTRLLRWLDRPGRARGAPGGCLRRHDDRGSSGPDRGSPRTPGAGHDAGPSPARAGGLPGPPRAPCLAPAWGS
jgi:hypothetical protein